MEYQLNHYRSRKIGDIYFVTTDHGSHCTLDEDEFMQLEKNDISDDLAIKLKRAQIILDSHTSDEAVRLTRNRHDFLFTGTGLHIVIPTLRCNMNCIYCHASSRPVDAENLDMDIKTAEKTVDFIIQTANNNLTIEFQGGEPLLNWEIVKHIISYAREKSSDSGKNIQFSLVTNLSFMDDEKMEFLIADDIGMCTSLDGPKEVHDFNRICHKKSNYDDVVFWIQKLSKEYTSRGMKKKVHALVTLTRKSLETPEGIIDEYARLGLSDIHLRFLNNIGIASKAWPMISYTSDEYIEFWKKSMEYIDKLNNEGVDIQERMAVIMQKKICSEFDPNYVDMRCPCGAAIGQLAYGHDGSIYSCDEGRMSGDDLFLLGNVHTDIYRDIVTCNKACAIITASMNDLYSCEACAYKPYCGVCPVINYAEQGSIIGRIPETDRCKIFMEQFDWIVNNRIIPKTNQ